MYTLKIAYLASKWVTLPINKRWASFPSILLPYPLIFISIVVSLFHVGYDWIYNITFMIFLKLLKVCDLFEMGVYDRKCIHILSNQKHAWNHSHRSWVATCKLYEIKPCSCFYRPHTSYGRRLQQPVIFNCSDLKFPTV